MKVLDVSAGRRNMWLNRRHPDATFVDVRPEMKPDVVADSRALPFADSTFDLVVFDPPHTTFGPNAQMAARYGSLKADEIRDLIIGSGREIARVLRPAGLVAFKWSDHGHVSREKVLSWMPHLEPLFGQLVKQVRGGHDSSTWWVMLRRSADAGAADEIFRQLTRRVA